MKIVVFGPQKRVGALVGETVIDLNRGLAHYLRERGEANPEQQAALRLPSRLLSLIETGAAALQDAQRVIEHCAGAPNDNRAENRVMHHVDDVKLHAPWPERRIACAGGNYAAHLLGMWANRLGKTDVSEEEVVREAKKAGQWGFWKVPAEVAGPNDARGKNISAEKIHEYVWGVTLFHDWSIRDSAGAERVVSYNLQKNFDGAVSMGPCIVAGELDHQDVDVETRVNAVARQSYNTREMIWSFGEVLEYLSQDFTFVPGDVIAGGTSAGTAADKSRRGPDGKRPLDLFLKVGDTVEVSSSKIGALSNRITASEKG
jgi:acylpyruvate hydrolase